MIAKFMCTWTCLLTLILTLLGQNAIHTQQALFKPLCKTAASPITHILDRYTGLNELQCGRKCAESRECRFWSQTGDRGGGGRCVLGMAAVTCGWEGGATQDDAKTYKHTAFVDCPAAFIPYRQSCYLFNHTRATWNETLDYCESIGASMVEIDDLLENQFISSIALSLVIPYNMWIGATREGPGNFTAWNSGRPVQFWSTLADDYGGSPSCLLMKPHMDTWRGIECNKTKLVVCEQPHL